MSKTKAAKRKRNAKPDLPKKAVKTSAETATPPGNGTALAIEPRNLTTLISEEELELTVETLQTLTEYPNLIRSKACKDLRVAVYDFRQACTTGLNTADASLTARISAALTDGKLTDVLILLAEMRIRKESPKLGALCRWVRDLDTVSGLSMQVDGVSQTTTPRSSKDLESLRVLDAVLRVTGPTDLNPDAKIPVSSDPIALQQVWSLHDTTTPPIQVRQQVLDGSILRHCTLEMRQKFEAIETIPGPQRKPPNHHELVLWTTFDNAFPLPERNQSLIHHKHPHVPNLSLVKDLLTHDECKTLIAITESIGFLPDAPVRDDGQEASILAHNVVWVIDQAFHDQLWSRVSACVPSHVGGKKARGINRRFRVYRYVPGAEYRAHIDGAWPPSHIDPVTKSYQYDCSPSDAQQSSLFTFLIYLNDEFEGGETTFFIPSVREGVMNAYPVKPVMGAVAIFPHGEAKGALLHEGTGVKKGAKYIIRTEIEYDVLPGRQ